MKRCVGCLLLTFLSIPTALPAQSGPSATLQVPRLEVGFQGGLIFDAGGGADGFALFAFGPRLTLNASQRDAIEIATDVLRPWEDGGLNGLYVIQYKRSLTERGSRRNTIVLSAGFGGVFHYERVDEYRWPRPDGSIYVRPAYTEGKLEAPFVVTVGVGVERVLAQYLAARAEVHLYIFRFGAFGVKGTYGISVPIGGYRDR